MAVTEKTRQYLFFGRNNNYKEKKQHKISFQIRNLLDSISAIKSFIKNAVRTKGQGSKFLLII